MSKLRTLAIALALVAALLPGRAEAARFGRSSSKGRSSSSSGSSRHAHVYTGTRAGSSAGASGGGGGMLRPSYGRGAWSRYGATRYGYHPYWGRVPANAMASGESLFTSATILSVMRTGDSRSMSVDAGLDGEAWGLQTRTSILQLSDGANAPDVVVQIAGYVSYSLIAEASARVRFEAGAMGLIAPDFSYAGPSMGVSGHATLLGPLGLYGAFHAMPVPVRVYDGEAGVHVQLGFVALRAGYRFLRLDDTPAHPGTDDGGVAILRGPQGSLGFVF